MAQKKRKRCSAHNSKGKPCRAWPIKGGTVCVAHGGAAPQVKAAARIRAVEMAAHETAERMLARAGIDADPIEHLLDSLQRATALMIVFGSLAAAIDDAAEIDAKARDEIRGRLGYREAGEDEGGDGELVVEARDQMMALNRHGEAVIHPYVLEYGKWVERRARFAKLCLDARIDDRLISIAEDQAQQFAHAITGILADLGVADNPEVPRVVRKHLTLLTGQVAA